LLYAIAVVVFENVRITSIILAKCKSYPEKAPFEHTVPLSLMARIATPKSIKKSGVRVGAFSGYDTFGGSL